MAYHSGDERVDLKLECVRIAIAGQYSPLVVLNLAEDMFDWVVDNRDDEVSVSVEPVDLSKMN